MARTIRVIAHGPTLIERAQQWQREHADANTPTPDDTYILIRDLLIAVLAPDRSAGAGRDGSRLRELIDKWREKANSGRIQGDIATALLVCMDDFDALLAVPDPLASDTGQGFDLMAHLQRQREWSERTFGPGARTAGVVDHIRKELREIEADPSDVSEWIDVAILALDGAWRAGYQPQQIIDALVGKQTKNEGRDWPDWRTAPLDKAIEHVKAAPLASSSAPQQVPAFDCLRCEGTGVPLDNEADKCGCLKWASASPSDDGARQDTKMETKP